MKNKNGKLACICAAPAYIFSQLGEYIFQHQYELIGNPIISPVINSILLPLRYIEAVLINRITFNEPSVTRLSLFYVFEGDAAVICFVLAIAFSAVAVYYSVKSALKHEFSIWYANSFSMSFLSIVTVNTWIGVTVTFAVLLSINPIRNHK